jgi:hypothetical protein
MHRHDIGPYRDLPTYGQAHGDVNPEHSAMVEAVESFHLAVGERATD